MDLAAAKRAAATTVSVCLPARDEERTIESIVREVARSGLADEIVVVDDGSTDRTAARAAAAGARVVAEAEILPEAGPGTGKGNVLWKSLHACRGDVICWLDADLRNFRAEYVGRLLEPLLRRPDLVFVKAFYERSFEGAPTGGGRVTELVARPLISLLFPKLAGVVQPLGGEYAGRREALEVLPFVQGWGVELALLVDVVERFGHDAVAQVDLGVREHRNRPLGELAPQALAIIVTALRRAGALEADHSLVELLRPTIEDGEEVALEATLVEVRERPPIVTVPAYRELRRAPSVPPPPPPPRG
ncbi:MAG: glucosyl-3-phosphoglycerate synthase [Acidimicrobiia bacterium]|nr:MAG: glucosyl-3-phosphoglycerate synthase [Acidimicrobiia bacterium]